MGLLDGKKIVITGVLTDASLAYGVARIAIDEGAEIVLTGAGRALSLTQRTARKLRRRHRRVRVRRHGARARADSVRDALAAKWGRVDGVLHAIGFAPASCLGDDFLEAPWDDVAVAMQISTYSLKTLVDAFLPLMGPAVRSSASTSTISRRGRPTTGWVSPSRRCRACRATWPRSSGRRGIRSNLVAAGPIKTMAAKSIPGFALFEDIWDDRAPLGWDVTNSEPVAKACVALLSDWFPATTGEIIHVDGGFHATGV